MTRVYAVDEVAQSMLLELMRRLRNDGYKVYLIDNDETITNTDALRSMGVKVFDEPGGGGLLLSRMLSVWLRRTPKRLRRLRLWRH